MVAGSRENGFAEGGERLAASLPPEVLDTAAMSAEALADPLKTTAKVAVAAALASTLAVAPASPDQVQLPQVTPIVHVIDFGADHPAPDQPADQATDERQSIFKKIMKALAVALIALLMAAGLLFGAAKGCVSSIAGPDADTDDNSRAADAPTEQVAPTTDEAAA